ncbi:hypothetical protein [Flavobacterium sp.]|uniref:hypothetical protein n=1 Tax=Flavobacterium sp. TaxID=239 RepID=UPI003797D67A
MKKIITLVIITLFTFSANAQQTKPATKETAKTEETAKCKMNGKKCSKEDMTKDAKKCCAKK